MLDWCEDDPFTGPWELPDEPLGYYDEFEGWPEDSVGPEYWLFKLYGEEDAT